MNVDIDRLYDIKEDLVNQFRKKITIFPLKSDQEIIEKIQKHIVLSTELSLWLTSECAYSNIIFNLENYKEKNKVIAVKNRTYGGNIRVSGLLQVEDFRIVLKENFSSLAKYSSVILPNEPFDLDGNDLMKQNYKLLEEEFNIKITLI